MKISAIVLCSVVFGSSWCSAKELSCVPRSEIGETTAGAHLFERDANLKISKPALIDFSSLTITSADGKRSKLTKVSDSVYKSVDPYGKYQVHLITNGTNTIVTEVSLSDTATYIKVLLCK